MKTIYLNKEQASNMMLLAGKDPEYGMEYLHGLEVLDPSGYEVYVYDKRDVERFINR